MKHLKYLMTEEEQPSVEYDYISFVEENKQTYANKYEYDYSNDYFSVVILTDGTFVFEANEDVDEWHSNAVSYSLNNGEWSEPTYNITLNVNANDSIRIKGNMQTDYSDNFAYLKELGIGWLSGGTASFDIQGNVMSLFLDDNFKDEEDVEIAIINSRYTYYHTFTNSKLISAENLVLPNIVSMGIYMSMFANCTTLLTPPQLPAMEVKDMCYSYMFRGCTSLKRSPILRATNLEYHCYANMFENCTNLKHITMFGTKNITKGLENWVKNVSSKGVFVKNKNATWDVYGDSGIPQQWIIQKM